MTTTTLIAAAFLLGLPCITLLVVLCDRRTETLRRRRWDSAMASFIEKKND